MRMTMARLARMRLAMGQGADREDIWMMACGGEAGRVKGVDDGAMPVKRMASRGQVLGHTCTRREDNGGGQDWSARMRTMMVDLHGDL